MEVGGEEDDDLDTKDYEEYDVLRKEKRREKHEILQKNLKKLGVSSVADLAELFEEEELKTLFTKYCDFEVIGSGGFGVVLKAKLRASMKPIAIKSVVQSNLNK